MILITGAAGFIASCLTQFLNRQFPDQKLLLVDDFSFERKSKNLLSNPQSSLIERDNLFLELQSGKYEIKQIYHLGARTDTTEKDTEIFDKLNLEYSKRLWTYAVKNKIPFVYASSAATYGDGSLGFDDNESQISNLKPLNPYGQSKQDFDLWVLAQDEQPTSWSGLKFFNVYGPNEYHKGRMASVVFHTYLKIKKTETMQLFRSHRDDFEDGMQSRDFIYVEDVIEVCHWLMNNAAPSGIYNLGTGKARSFLDLASNVFYAMDLDPKIEFIDTPQDIRDTYQYYTQANMNKLRSAGYEKAFTSLEDGIKKYVIEYLMQEKNY